jgi:hypothetical protein
MVICKGTNHAYYPMSDKGPALIGGSGRIRYFRGFILVIAKDSPVIGSLAGRRDGSGSDRRLRFL